MMTISQINSSTLQHTNAMQSTSIEPINCIWKLALLKGEIIISEKNTLCVVIPP